MLAVGTSAVKSDRLAQVDSHRIFAELVADLEEFRKRRLWATSSLASTRFGVLECKNATLLHLIYITPGPNYDDDGVKQPTRNGSRRQRETQVRGLLEFFEALEHVKGIVEAGEIYRNNFEESRWHDIITKDIRKTMLQLARWVVVR